MLFVASENDKQSLRLQWLPIEQDRLVSAERIEQLQAGILETPLGHLKVDRYLGVGYLGSVYAARTQDEHHGFPVDHPVAVKIMRSDLDLEGREAFFSEIITLAELLAAIKLEAASVEGYQIARPAECFSSSKDKDLLVLELMKKENNLGEKITKKDITTQEIIALSIQALRFFDLLHSKLDKFYSDLKRENSWWDKEAQQLFFTDFNVLKSVKTENGLDGIKRDYYRLLHYVLDLFCVMTSTTQAGEVSETSLRDVLVKMGSEHQIVEMAQVAMVKLLDIVSQAQAPAVCEAKPVVNDLVELQSFYAKDASELIETELNPLIFSLADSTIGVEKQRQIAMRVRSMIQVLQDKLLLCEDKDLLGKFVLAKTQFYRQYPVEFIQDNSQRERVQNNAYWSVFSRRELAGANQEELGKLSRLLVDLSNDQVAVSAIETENWQALYSQFQPLVGKDVKQVLLAFGLAKREIAKDEKKRQVFFLAYTVASASSNAEYLKKVMPQAKLLNIVRSFARTDQSNDASEQLAEFTEARDLILGLNDEEQTLFTFVFPEFPKKETLDGKIAVLDQEVARTLPDIATSWVRTGVLKRQLHALHAVSSGQTEWQLHSAATDTTIEFLDFPPVSLAHSQKMNVLRQKLQTSHLFFMAGSTNEAFKGLLANGDILAIMKDFLVFNRLELSSPSETADRGLLIDKLRKAKERYKSFIADMPEQEKVKAELVRMCEDEIYNLDLATSWLAAVDKAASCVDSSTAVQQNFLDALSKVGELYQPRLDFLVLSDPVALKMLKLSRALGPDCLALKHEMQQRRIFSEDIFELEQQTGLELQRYEDEVQAVSPADFAQYRVYLLANQYLSKDLVKTDVDKMTNSLAEESSTEGLLSKIAHLADLLTVDRRPNYEIKLRGGAAIPGKMSGGFEAWLHEQALIETVVKIARSNPEISDAEISGLLKRYDTIVTGQSLTVLKAKSMLTMRDLPSDLSQYVEVMLAVERLGFVNALKQAGQLSETLKQQPKPDQTQLQELLLIMVVLPQKATEWLEDLKQDYDFAEPEDRQSYDNLVETVQLATTESRQITANLVTR